MQAKQLKIIRWAIVCILVVVGAMFLGYWMKKDFSMSQKRNSYLIGMSYMTMNNEFYKIIGREISGRVEAEGDRVVLRDPALDVDRQIEQIHDMLDMGIDVLVLTPVNHEKLTSVLERARDMGVKIVVVDSNVNDDEMVDCTITSDNYNAGAVVGNYFLQHCSEAKVVVMTHETTKSGKDRVQGFLDKVSSHKGIEIVQTIECEGQTELAMPAIEKAIENGTVFDTVFCLNDLAGVGVVAALEEHQMLDEVTVYGVDASPDAKALIKEGMMKASAAQFPSEIGTKAADAIYQLLQGEKTEKQILVPIKLITRENVEEFGINRWQ